MLSYSQANIDLPQRQVYHQVVSYRMFFFSRYIDFFLLLFSENRRKGSNYQQYITYLSSHIWLTSCILINDSDRLPLVELHYVQHSSAYGGVLGVEVDVEAVLVVHWRVFPACLDVRDFQGVTNRLHRTDRWAVRGAKHSPDTQSQLVTCWDSETGKRDEMKKQETRTFFFFF